MFPPPFVIYAIIVTVKKMSTLVGGGVGSGAIGLNPSKCFIRFPYCFNNSHILALGCWDTQVWDNILQNTFCIFVGSNIRISAGTPEQHMSLTLLV